MALRLRTSIVRGEVDNREKGRITGRVWLVGRDEPVELALEGNGHRDVAGCLFTFVNPNPVKGDEHTCMHALQQGKIGDYTASRKVRAFDIPLDDALAAIRRGERPPEHWANCLYLEWFSERNGRVVIESYDYEMKIVEKVWSLDEAGEQEQLQENAASMVDFMNQLGEVLGEQPPEEEPPEPAIQTHMDEFAWERFMKKSDERTEAFGKLLEKYKDHPDRDKLVARAMGWDKLADNLEAYDDAVEKGEVDPFDLDDMDFVEPEPNPLTEGTDWIMGRHGHPVHPLQQRATDIVMHFWQECKEAGFMEESTFDSDVHDMLFNGQCVGAKMAGALNSLAYDRDVDGGFVVAYLKRALPFFDQMMLALEKVSERELIPDERLRKFANEMFEIRSGILELIERFRTC